MPMHLRKSQNYQGRGVCELLADPQGGGECVGPGVTMNLFTLYTPQSNGVSTEICHSEKKDKYKYDIMLCYTLCGSPCVECSVEATQAHSTMRAPTK